MGRVMAKKRLAILISGRGSNMMALVAAARAANYPAEVAAIISNRPDAAGLAWARAEGLPVTLIDHKAYPSREAFDATLDQVLVAADVELIALAGFMRIQSATFVRKWQGRQLNIHPSLLPAFKGLNPHAQALQAGVKISGCTVHFVSEELDGGPIIARRRCPCARATAPNRSPPASSWPNTHFIPRPGTGCHRPHPAQRGSRSRAPRRVNRGGKTSATLAFG
jgi:phosphoribosylglycinamide formyltransferase-1